jgi:N-acetylglucosamine-6-phosphate deacetylase
MATLTPARIVGRDRELGSIAPGKVADLIILDKTLEVRQVYLAGKSLS